jgi:hypothetical protein
VRRRDQRNKEEDKLVQDDARLAQDNAMPLSMSELICIEKRGTWVLVAEPVSQGRLFINQQTQERRLITEELPEEFSMATQVQLTTRQEQEPNAYAARQTEPAVTKRSVLQESSALDTFSTWKTCIIELAGCVGNPFQRFQLHANSRTLSQVLSALLRI